MLSHQEVYHEIKDLRTRIFRTRKTLEDLLFLCLRVYLPLSRVQRCSFCQSSANFLRPVSGGPWSYGICRFAERAAGNRVLVLAGRTTQFCVERHFSV